MSKPYHLHIEATHRTDGRFEIIDEDVEQINIRITMSEKIADLEDRGFRIDRVTCPKPDEK